MSTFISLERYQFTPSTDVSETLRPISQGGLANVREFGLGSCSPILLNTLYSPVGPPEYTEEYICTCPVQNSWITGITNDTHGGIISTYDINWYLDDCSTPIGDICGTPDILTCLDDPNCISQPLILNDKSTYDRGVWNCVYDVNKFVSGIQLATYRASVINNPAVTANPELAALYYNTIILPNICGKTATENCPEGHETCSMFLEQSDIGAECRAWAIEQPVQADSVKETYCLNNQDAPECACILRTNNPEYESIKVPFPDYCFYIPCMAGSGNLLLERDMRNGEQCGNYCASIFTYIDSTGGTISIDFQKNIDCDFTKNTGPAPKPTPTPGEVSFFEQHKGVLIGVSVGMVVLIILVILLLIFLR
jgi:hypothetical protein